MNPDLNLRCRSEKEFNDICSRLENFTKNTPGHERILFDDHGKLVATGPREKWCTRVIQWLKRFFSCNHHHPAIRIANNVVSFFEANTNFIKTEHALALSSVYKIKHVKASDINPRYEALKLAVKSNSSTSGSQIETAKQTCEKILADAKEEADNIRKQAKKDAEAAQQKEMSSHKDKLQSVLQNISTMEEKLKKLTATAQEEETRVKQLREQTLKDVEKASSEKLKKLQSTITELEKKKDVLNTKIHAVEDAPLTLICKDGTLPGVPFKVLKDVPFISSLISCKQTFDKVQNLKSSANSSSEDVKEASEQNAAGAAPLPLDADLETNKTEKMTGSEIREVDLKQYSLKVVRQYVSLQQSTTTGPLETPEEMAELFDLTIYLTGGTAPKADFFENEKLLKQSKYRQYLIKSLNQQSVNPALQEIFINILVKYSANFFTHEVAELNHSLFLAFLNKLPNPSFKIHYDSIQDWVKKNNSEIEGFDLLKKTAHIQFSTTRTSIWNLCFSELQNIINDLADTDREAIVKLINCGDYIVASTTASQLRSRRAAEKKAAAEKSVIEKGLSLPSVCKFKTFSGFCLYKVSHLFQPTRTECDCQGLKGESPYRNFIYVNTIDHEGRKYKIYLNGRVTGSGMGRDHRLDIHVVHFSTDPHQFKVDFQILNCKPLLFSDLEKNNMIRKDYNTYIPEETDPKLHWSLQPKPKVIWTGFNIQKEILPYLYEDAFHFAVRIYT